jgi:hypothetical protein
MYTRQTMAAPGHSRTHMDEIPSKNAEILVLFKYSWISPDVPG